MSGPPSTRGKAPLLEDASPLGGQSARCGTRRRRGGVEEAQQPCAAACGEEGAPPAATICQSASDATVGHTPHQPSSGRPRRHHHGRPDLLGEEVVAADLDLRRHGAGDVGVIAAGVVGVAEGPSEPGVAFTGSGAAAGRRAAKQGLRRSRRGGARAAVASGVESHHGR